MLPALAGSILLIGFMPFNMKIRKYNDQIWNIRGKPLEWLNFNSYIIIDEKITLIDPVYVDIEEYEEVLSKINLKISDFDLILSTHWHVDHSSKAGAIKEVSGAVYMIHEKEKPLLESFEERVNNLGKFKDNKKFFKQWKSVQNFWEFRSCSVDHVFQNGEIIDLGKLKLEVIYTPGHTGGHCSFLLPVDGKKILFAGDMSPKEHLWYGYIAGSVTEYINSLRLLKNMNWDAMFSGHYKLFKKNSAVEELYDKVINILLERDEKIFNYVKKGHSTLEDIISLYPTVNSRNNLWDDFTEFCHVSKHLARLEELNLIRSEEHRGKIKWKVN